MNLDDLQKEYEALLAKPFSSVPGFVHYRGNEHAKHIILGEDHSPQAGLAIENAFRRLVIPNMTIVIGEAAQGAIQGTISSLEEAWKYRNDLTRWQQDSLSFLIENKVPLQIHDSSSYARHVQRTKGVKGQTGRFMHANSRRDYAFAANICDKVETFGRVIGVFGSLHVLSPVFNRALEEIDCVSYVFKPSSAR